MGTTLYFVWLSVGIAANIGVWLLSRSWECPLRRAAVIAAVFAVAFASGGVGSDHAAQWLPVWFILSKNFPETWWLLSIIGVWWLVTFLIYALVAHMWQQLSSKNLH